MVLNVMLHKYVLSTLWPVCAVVHKVKKEKKKRGVDGVYVIRMGHFTLMLDGC